MANYSKYLLSLSDSGKSIAIANVNPGNANGTIHVSSATSGVYDEVYLYGYNGYGSTINGTLWWGGTTPNDMQVFPFTNGAGRIMLTDGRLLSNGAAVQATTVMNGTSGLTLDGFVNRITN